MIHTTSLIFDIETIVDIDLYRSTNDFDQSLSNKELSEIFKSDKKGFPPIVYHKIVSLSSILLQDTGDILIITDSDSDEKKIIGSFLYIIESLKPVIVSWNGSNFDLPVIQYRMLKYNIPSPVLMDMGTLTRDNKWNNYRSRYHDRHTDLADVMCNHGSKMSGLNDTSLLIGLPGKMGVGGDQVSSEYYSGNIKGITDYNIIDVINTTFLYIRYSEITGKIDNKAAKDIILKLIDEISVGFEFNELISNYMSKLSTSNFIKSYGI